MSITKKNKDKALELALAAMTKSFGGGFNRLGSNLEKVNTFRTGHDELDSVLVKDGFGIARGKIIELSGVEGSGKSSIALRICGYAQKEGYTPLWLDVERSLTKGGIAEINGVDMEKMILPDLVDTKATDVEDADVSPYNAGQILDMVMKAIETGAFNPVVLDSVAALIPEREMNAESLNDEQMMEMARLLSKALRKIIPMAASKDVCVIFVNQERDKPNAMGMPAVTTPGGRALKFYSSQRLRLTKVGGKEGEIKETLEDGRQNVVGHWARVKILKNRCAPPYFDAIEVPIYYKSYFPDDVERLFEAAKALQVITSRNNVITWKSGGESVFRVEGTAKALNTIREEKLSARLAKECIAAESSEKNKSKKVPFKLPVTLAKLAEETATDDGKSV